jgi:hypothetical protein
VNVDFVKADRPQLVLRRARLFARVHRPDQLIDGESYCVELAVPRFEVLWGGQSASVAHAQLIATFEPADAVMADCVCAFCECRRERLMMPETAICSWCLDLMRKVMWPSA